MPAMHLVITHAGNLGEDGAAAAPAPVLPGLARLLGGMQAAETVGSDEFSLDTPAEAVLAALRGEPPAVAAWLAADAGLDASRPWALLTPVHLSVSTDGVRVFGPESLALSDAESRACFDALSELWPAAEGWLSACVSPAQWLVSHASLAGLPSASLDRVVQRNVEPWLPEARRLRSLQNEVQMLLHRHPVNASRALEFNSVWISGCGSSSRVLPADVRVDSRLREPQLAGDGAAWAQAWQALDAELAQLAPVRITLCGERLARTFAIAEPLGLMARLKQKLSPKRVDIAALLQSL
jgi:hypothetical protein